MDDLHQAGGPELASGDVDGHGQRIVSRPLAVPVGDLGARLGKDRLRLGQHDGRVVAGRRDGDGQDGEARHTETNAVGDGEMLLPVIVGVLRHRVGRIQAMRLVVG